MEDNRDRALRDHLSSRDSRNDLPARNVDAKQSWDRIYRIFQELSVNLARFLGSLALMALLRLAITLEREGGYQLRGALRQSRKPNAKVVLLEFHRHVAAVHRHRTDLVQQVANHHCLSGPVVNMRKQRIASARVADIISAARLAVIRKTNGVAVLAHPLPNRR